MRSVSLARSPLRIPAVGMGFPMAIRIVRPGQTNSDDGGENGRSSDDRYRHGRPLAEDREPRRTLFEFVHLTISVPMALGEDPQVLAASQDLHRVPDLASPAIAIDHDMIRTFKRIAKRQGP